MFGEPVALITTCACAECGEPLQMDECGILLGGCSRCEPKPDTFWRCSLCQHLVPTTVVPHQREPFLICAACVDIYSVMYENVPKCELCDSVATQQLPRRALATRCARCATDDYIASETVRCACGVPATYGTREQQPVRCASCGLQGDVQLVDVRHELCSHLSLQPLERHHNCLVHIQPPGNVRWVVIFSDRTPVLKLDIPMRLPSLNLLVVNTRDASNMKGMLCDIHVALNDPSRTRRGVAYHISATERLHAATPRSITRTIVSPRVTCSDCARLTVTHCNECGRHLCTECIAARGMCRHCILHSK